MMCHLNRIVSKQDEIIWKHEFYIPETKVMDKSALGSMLQTQSRRSKDTTLSLLLNKHEEEGMS
jgi:hypothetical protein